MSTNTYRALSAFVQDNTRYDKGVIVQLTDKQATYLISGGFVELLPAPPPDNPPADAAEGDIDSPARNRKGAKA